MFVQNDYSTKVIVWSPPAPSGAFFAVRYNTNMSVMLKPKAKMVKETTVGGISSTHAKSIANSLRATVRLKIARKHTITLGIQYYLGGITLNSTFQPIVTRWQRH